MQTQYALDTHKLAPADTIEVKEGVQVSWEHIDGTQRNGTVTKNFGARLWYVMEDDGTEHVVGSWVLKAPEWYVLLDARDNRRGVQVYDKARAIAMAEQLNNYVHRNGLGQLFPTAKVTGPFYPVRATENELKPYLLRNHLESL